MALIDKASLLMVPSVYEDGTLYNVLPSGNKAPDETGNHNGYDQTRADFTFSRGSNLAATRVNASGLIEKGRENLLLQSNQFDTSPWGLDGSTITGGQLGYDGSNNAWLFTKTGSFDGLNQGGLSVSGVSTISIYAKIPTGETDANAVLFRIDDSSGNSIVAFNLTNSAVPSLAGNAVAANKVDLGNGWYRCSLSVNANVSKVHFRPAFNTSTSKTTGSLLYQSAQLEKGLVATDYIETGSSTATAGVLENTPRIDYSSGAGALLLEPQRTNLYPYSEYSGAWIKSNWTTTDNYAISPEGVKNAFRAVSTATNGTLYINATGTTGQKNTLSVWAKSNTGSDQKFRFFADGYTTISNDFTATTEWQRFEFTHDCTFVTAGITGASSELSDILFYGFQQEAGSYVSSYIPTYGSAATRGADSCSVTGASDVIGQTEGTLYADFIFDGKPTSIDYNIMILGAIGSNYINIGGYNTSLYARVFNSTLQGTINALQMVAGTRYKVAVAYANNDVVMYVNGANEGTDTSASIPAVSQIGFSRPSFEAKTNILNAQVYKERLTNSELATLTTL